MTPWTHPHANVAVRSDISPVIKTGLGIQLPPKTPIALGVISQRDGIGRAAYCAFITDPAKILDSYVRWFVRHERKVSGYSP